MAAVTSVKAFNEPLDRPFLRLAGAR